MSEDEKPSKKARKKQPSVKVDNNNQQGGIGYVGPGGIGYIGTQINNNYAPPERHLGDEMKGVLLRELPKTKAIQMKWIGDDPETYNLMIEIRNFMRDQGYNVNGPLGHLVPAVPLKQDIEFDVRDPAVIAIVVGPRL